MAFAHYSPGNYIYQGGQQKDPTNITFYSTDYYNPAVPPGNATWQASVEHVVHHLGTWTNTQGGLMQFWDHGAYRDQHAQRGECVECNRYHVRFRQGEDADASWGTYTVASVHFDELRYFCGGQPVNHVATGFDSPRDTLAYSMASSGGYHPPPYSAYNNNTDPSPQCDGRQTRSVDGVAQWVWIGPH